MSQHQELIELFKSGLAAVRQAIQGVSVEGLTFHRSPEKWSIQQICLHLADTEIAVGFRIRNILSEDKPALQPFDQDRWADALHYEQQDLELALQQFEILRQANIKLIESLPEEAFARTGVHPKSGELTLAALLDVYGKHVFNHIRQIQEIRGLFEEK